MRYWDSSALVPLCVEEPSTQHMRQLLTIDPIVITWWTTELECVSAISRLEREGRLCPPRRNLRKSLDYYAISCIKVVYETILIRPYSE